MVSAGPELSPGLAHASSEGFGSGSFETFGWQALNKRRRLEPLQAVFSTVFARGDDLEGAVEEEAAPPSLLRLAQLEDSTAKCKRLAGEGNFLAEAERYAEALDRWKQALVFADDMPAGAEEAATLLEQSSQVLLLLNRDFEAVQAAQRAVERRPLWHCGHLTLGRALLAFGELRFAVDALRQSAELVDESVTGTADAKEIRSELADAERLLLEAQTRCAGSRGSCKSVAVNGRIVESRFWETALKVTYDAEGRPTTHYEP